MLNNIVCVNPDCSRYGAEVHILKDDGKCVACGSVLCSPESELTTITKPSKYTAIAAKKRLGNAKRLARQEMVLRAFNESVANVKKDFDSYFASRFDYEQSSFSCADDGHVLLDLFLRLHLAHCQLCSSFPYQAYLGRRGECVQRAYKSSFACLGFRQSGDKLKSGLASYEPCGWSEAALFPSLVHQSVFGNHSNQSLGLVPVKLSLVSEYKKLMKRITKLEKQVKRIKVGRS